VPRLKPPSVAATPPTIRTIPDDAVFRLDELRLVLGLPRTSLRREARQGRLRVSKRCGFHWTTGRWVRQWVAAGEVTRRQPAGLNGEAVAR
jgi:hypothetical protein